jgi:hypothetical protein
MNDTTGPQPAAENARPVRDEHGRFIYDATYDPADGDKYDDNTHLQGLGDNN